MKKMKNLIRYIYFFAFGAIFILLFSQNSNAQFNVNIVATSSDTAPGIDLPFNNFDNAFISNKGTVVFSGRAGDEGVWIFKEDVLRGLAVNGNTVPGLPGVMFSSTSEGTSSVTITPEGEILIHAQFSGNGIDFKNDTGLLSYRDSTLNLIAQEGTVVLQGNDFSFNWGQLINLPGSPDKKASLNAGYTIFPTDLTNEFGSIRGAGIWAVNTETGQNISIVTGAGGFEEISVLPGTNLLTNGTNAIKNRVLINNSQEYSFVISGFEPPHSNSFCNVLYRGVVGSEPVPLLRDPDCMNPEMEVSNLTINNDGQVAFYGKIPGRTESGIWVEESSGSFRLALEIGAFTPDPAGEVFTDVDGFVLLDDGRIVALARTSDTANGIWMEDETTGELEKVVHSGDMASGVPVGNTFDTIGTMVVNNEGKVAFSAFIQGPDIGSLNMDGLWLGDLNGTELIVQNGSSIEIEPGVFRTIASIAIPNSNTSNLGDSGRGDGTGANGQPTFFNDAGELVVSLGFFEDDPFLALVIFSKSFIVNVTNDATDSTPGDGLCDTGGPEVDGNPECSLRAALEEANASEGSDRIQFDIPGKTPHIIQPKSSLPEIQESVVIDGFSQESTGDFPPVILDGVNAGNNAHGFTVPLDGRRTTIRGLSIVNFSGNGIHLENTFENSISGNFIGLLSSGEAAGNAGSGIYLMQSHTNQIGSTNVSDRNVISGNGEHGVVISGDNSINDIIGNYIGTGPGGISAQPNSMSGILITNGASDNKMYGNLISGNGEHGVYIGGTEATPSGNVLQNNKIGLNTDGMAALPNQGNGIFLDNALTSRIGNYSGAGGRNLISGNKENGIMITGPAGGHVIAGNYIGTNLQGNENLSNGMHGIYVSGSQGNIIGEIIGTQFITGNLISGNALDGIHMEGTETRENEIKNNLIGTTATGEAALPNRNGIFAEGLTDLTIGDSEIANRNVISGNNQEGILLIDIDGSGMNDDVLVVNNYIGTDFTGNQAFGNRNGILLSGSEGVLIGGRVQDESVSDSKGNLISGNRNDGIKLQNSDIINILGNLIGTTSDGETELENQGIGVNINNGSFNRIGNNRIRFSNIISGNLTGIHINGISEENSIMFNFIGTQFQLIEDTNDGAFLPDAKNLGNSTEGIFLEDAANTFVIRNKTFFNRNGIRTKLNDLFPSDGRRVGDHIISRNIIWNSIITGISVENGINDQIYNNQIIENDIGILLEGQLLGMDISANFLRKNDTGIENRAMDSDLLINNNNIEDQQALATGIHLFGGRAQITGNQITGDAGDAIALEQGAEAEIIGNNLFENTGMGINNVDGTATVDGSGNWWGDPSGPGGSGPGSGEEVSTGVDFDDWLTNPVDLVVTPEADTIYIEAGKPDTVDVFLRNWVDPASNVDVTLSDEQGWIDGPASIPMISLDENLGAEFEIPVSVPAGTMSATNRVEVITTSSTNEQVADTTFFVVKSFESMLAEIEISPDSVDVDVGGTQQFEVTGRNQVGEVVAFNPTWTATGGTIDENGLFTAGDETGIFSVTAEGPENTQATAVVNIVVFTSNLNHPELPDRVELSQNYPNPFNPTTNIEFALPSAGQVKLSVFNILGQRVATLVDSFRPAGFHSVVFDGRGLSSGIYIYRLETKSTVKIQKMVLVK